jgi:hypothetical protein
MIVAGFRHVCAFGAALNVFALMAANLAGFVLGGGNLKRECAALHQGTGILHGLSFIPLHRPAGALWLVANERAVVASTFATFFSAATIMLNRRYH